MKLRIAAACAVTAFMCASSAMADTRLTATLETPKATKVKFIAAHAVWVCENGACTAAAAPDDSTDVNSCKEVARHVGRLTAYAGETKSLDAAGLARCNTVAPATTASR
jgi:hypothetical protein